MFTESDARNVANILKIEFINFTIQDLLNGMNEELEHGTNYTDTNITNDSPVLTAKIALAHLNVYPNYYNKDYGITHFEKLLQEKLAKEQYEFPNITLDDVKEKEC